ncbi:lipoyl(octanoyl) transferase LipB, partial [Pelagibacteraceae bacterium]|nr:lipoyl(octanoyl) transferase LipB [Pelagibacteraceae bacterium]
ILEHRAVYTGGTSSKITDLLNKKIKIVKTGRGGKYTYHGPGQKVVYFVLNLNERGKDIRKLLNQVERCIISILDDYKIESFADKKNIGIWVKNEKIAAIGIKVKKWVAYHGFALNVSTDISKYKGIIPCGIKGKKITSLKKLGISNHKDIHRIISKNFLNTFL